MPPDAPVDRLVTLPEGLPELTLGWEVVKWTTKYLRQPNGANAGRAFQPVDSQVRFWLWWYAVDPDGRWLFHRAVRRLAKGSGKSPFAAVQGLAELCGPVRLKDFDPRVPGGCVGKPVAMPLVQVVATSEQQTANTMRMVRAFAPKKSRLVADYNLDPGKEKYFLPPEGTLEQRTSSATAAEGSEASFIVGDETEWWRPGNGGDSLAATLLDNLAKSGSRMLETCNAWIPGQESVAEKSFDAWVAQEEGRTKGDSRILYDARIAPPETKLENEESLRAGLDFVYDDCWWSDRTAIVNRIWDLSSTRADSTRKYLNRPSAADDAWTTPAEWALLTDAEKTVEDGESVVLFLDPSESRDATGLAGCRMSDGHIFTVGVYEPDPSHDNTDTVSLTMVDGWLVKAFEKYDVVGFFSDVHPFEQSTKVTWPDLYRSKLLVHAVPGGKDPQPIAWDMRSKSYDFGLACELTISEIEAQGFTHDGGSVMARHVANARRRPNKYGSISIGKESTSSPRKVDLAVCMVGARMVRRLVLAAPAWQKRHRGGKGRVIVLG